MIKFLEDPHSSYRNEPLVRYYSELYWTYTCDAVSPKVRITNYAIQNVFLAGSGQAIEQFSRYVPIKVDLVLVPTNI
jgi:hypothetical protein